MPSFYFDMPRTNKEPQSRFYPTQGSDSTNQPTIPSAPTPQRPVSETPTMPQNPTPRPMPRPQLPPEPLMMPQEIPAMPDRRTAPRGRTGEMPYFKGNYPIMLQRLYDAAGALLDTYSHHDFLYDAYPDYLSLRLMRDRLLRENTDLTEEYLQAGCPIMWLEMLADTILSEQLCRRRREARNPKGENPSLA